MSTVTKRTILAHAKALREREYSSRELTEEFYSEIERKDGITQAHLALSKDEAFRAADNADKLLSHGEGSVLCGIPCTVKDNIMTQGTPTTCASRILENYIPPYDATVVELLKKEGAVILGKTNLDEFAMGSDNQSSAFKKTVNPYDRERVPGGSSGGGAAAVADGTAAYAIGSDTGGSARQPAAFCSLVSMKPTYGRVSRYGLCALASSMDQIAPITRTVADNAAVLSALACHDRRDATSLEKGREDYTTGICDGVRGTKIGICTEMTDIAEPEVRDAVYKTADILKSLGCEVFETSLPSLSHSLAAYRIICCAEASSNMSRFDGIRYTEKVGGELFTEARQSLLGPEVRRRILLGTWLLSHENYEKYYLKALQAKQLITDEIKEAFTCCDALLSPTVLHTAFSPDTMPKDRFGTYSGDVCCMSANLSGMPSLSVPVGFDSDGMPIGALLTGNFLSEGLLYRLGNAVETVQKEGE